LIERLHEVAAPVEESKRRRAIYETQRSRFETERDDLRRRWNIVGNLRLAAIVAAGAALFAALQFGLPLFYVVAAALVIVFIALIVHHRQLGRARRRAAARHDVKHEALLRMDRNWTE
jgi:hypothetical protein